MTVPATSDLARNSWWTGPVIDCDVHANVPSLKALLPYQAPVWQQFTRDRGWDGPKGVDVIYPPNLPSSARSEWRPQDGSPPSSSVEHLRTDVLDALGVERAVLSCYYAVDSLRHPDWAAALASSVNDWVAEEWLARDSRLAGSIVVPARDPQAAVDEIERLAGHPGFVQVLLPARSDRLYGQRIWHPVLEAIERHGLVAGLTFGGVSDGPPGTSGFPSWYVEEYAAETQVFAGQITSMVAEGVFRKFPGLRVSVLEGGFTWLPTWGWRMNKEWKGLRREIPWVDRPPLDIIRDHFRFSIAPLDAGPPEQMARIIDWLGSEDLLMFATDYPHGHDDDVAPFVNSLPRTFQEKLMAETAREWYRL